MKHTFSSIFVFVALFINVSYSYGQADTTQLPVDTIPVDTIQKVELEQEINSDFLSSSNAATANHSPKKAALLSTIVPGLGQVYNKKYWKVGVIYAVEGFLIYRIVDFNKQYKQYRDELFMRDMVTAQPEIQWTSSNNELSELSDDVIRTRKDIFRTQRDRYFLFATAMYAVNILDAVVDAHLIGFNTKKNRAITVIPTVIPNYQMSANLGFNLRVRF